MFQEIWNFGAPRFLRRCLQGFCGYQRVLSVCLGRQVQAAARVAEQQQQYNTQRPQHQTTRTRMNYIHHVIHTLPGNEVYDSGALLVG